MTIENKRHNYVLKDFIVPILSAVIPSVAIGWGGLQYGIGTIKTQVEELDEEVQMLTLSFGTVTSLQITQGRLQEKIDNAEEELKQARQHITELKTRIVVLETENKKSNGE